QSIAAQAPIQLDFLDDACRAHFEQVQSYLQTMEIEYKINPRIVRGLDYYTHTAFEFLNPSLGAQNAIGGGGRYNGLIEQIGGKSIPAVGFAGGFERLLLSLEQENIYFKDDNRPIFYLVGIDDYYRNELVYIQSELRKRNISSFLDLEKASVSSLFKQANKYSPRYVLIYGDEEFHNRGFTIKDFVQGTQYHINVSSNIRELYKKSGIPLYILKATKMVLCKVFRVK
ncbi:MAG: ATP phosphoribosyltransferase regulatory subunit, partial [Candidatus Cloacimonadaceae bacterium]